MVLCYYDFLLMLHYYVCLRAEEGQDEYEKDGFIVDDVEEEEEQDEEGDTDEERHKKKKRRKR